MAAVAFLTKVTSEEHDGLLQKCSSLGGIGVNLGLGCCQLVLVSLPYPLLLVSLLGTGPCLT